MVESRKKPDLKPIGHLNARDAIWKAIRALAGPTGDGLFDRHDIARRSRASEHQVEDYAKLLADAGILATVTPASRQPAPGAIRKMKHDGGFQTPARLRLAIDKGVDTPRFDKARHLVTEPTNRERIWAAIKAAGAFSAPEIASIAAVKPSEADAYLRHLARAGYLQQVAASTNRSAARWRLMAGRNTGPRPPVIRKGGVVYDLNLGRQVYPAAKVPA